MVGGRLGPDFYEALVEGSSEFLCAFDPQGTIVFASSSSVAVLGWSPAELVGRNVAELLHPDDLFRAAEGMTSSAERGAPGGTSSFRVLCGDGAYAEIDMSVGNVDLGPDGPKLVSVSCRPADYQHAVDEILQDLLNGGASTADTLRPVLDSIAWKPNGSSVAISWHEPGVGYQFVSSGLPAALTGAEDDPGAQWAHARATGRSVAEEAPVALDPSRAALAEAQGLGGLWIEAVPDLGSEVPALITIWTNADRPVKGHAYGMSIAKRFTELILRWRFQIGRLEDAAYRDPLTGLGNRQVFFDVLTDERPGGALLYCDLDRFKPVNDELGHAVGDELLRRVATRLRSCVRAEDLLARLGGDEFAVLCRGATTEQAQDLAGRITAAFEAPFVVGDREVDIGISIGIAHATTGLSEDTLDAADRDLYEQKARRRGAG